MVNISKDNLKAHEIDQIFDQLSTSLSGLNDKQTKWFLLGLLGNEEKIVLAKRLAAILMLTHGHSVYRVAERLKISSSTAKVYKMNLKEGTYDLMLESLKKQKKNYLTLIETLDSLLHLGGILPHYNGRDRYKNLPH